MRRSLAALGCVLAMAGAQAQWATPDPDWKERDAPPPPVLRTEGLVAIEVPGSTLRFGVDPRSVTLSTDGIVRYVVVAAGASGAINALYEGVRCNTAEVKVYARHNPGSGWVPTDDADWAPLHGRAQARHSLQIARIGACMGHSPNRSAQQIVRDLRAPVDTRFVN